MKNATIQLKNKILAAVITYFILCFWLTGCTTTEESDNQYTAESTTRETEESLINEVASLETTSEIATEITTEPIERTTEITLENTTPSVETTVQQETVEVKDYRDIISETSLTADDIPEYTGTDTITINNNVPFFTEEQKKYDKSFIYLEELDELGRCGYTYSSLHSELLPTEERGEIGHVRPSGWHTVKYPEVISDLYLYNRSHLQAYSITGLNDDVRNLITGTRQMNAETMLPYEMEVLDALRDNGNLHIAYRVTPVFKDEELVARGVLMEAFSIEDNGSTICFNIFCYNTQDGIGIDYATGESWLIEPEITTEQTTESSTEVTTADSTLYILNTNTKKFHYPSCSSVDDMKESNKQEYTGTYDEITAMGYAGCKRCVDK